MKIKKNEETDLINKVKINILNQNIERNSQSKIKIAGVSLWRILGYFIIYSLLGYIVEVLYGMVTKGVIESRQSFLYGPFCGIYGYR